jgi:multidrug efflux system outer membrane protein
MFVEVQPGLPSDLLTRRPDIVAAEHALKAANANIGAARAAFFPQISLTGIAGLASTALGSLFSAGSVAWIFMPSLSQPIFEGGRRQAALDLSEVRREQAIVRYEQTIQTAFRDVSDALSARHWLQEQVRILGETLRVQAERARLAALRYDSGAGRYLEVLDAERELLAVEQQLVQTRRALLASHVALYAVLGGGPLPVAEVTP